MRRLLKRQAHLNAHITPVEAALLARAEVLEQEAADEDGSKKDIAAEFRALADELHWF